MTWSVLWTLLPAGFDPTTGAARLSLVASPRNAGPARTLGESPLGGWPGIVAGLGPIRIATATGGSSRASVVGPAPEPDLWNRLFAPTTVLGAPPGAGAEVLTKAGPAYLYREAYDGLRSLYTDAARTSPERLLARDHPVVRRIGGLRRWAGAESPGVASAAGAGVPGSVASLLDPGRLTPENLRRAAELLRAAGDPDAAAMAAVAQVTRRNRIRYEPSAGSGVINKLGSVHQADFHQIVGMLLDHPALARRLGLIVDLETDPFDGERTIRAVTADGKPLNGPVPLRQPWTRVLADLGDRRFVMATQAGAPTEIRNGMLDLSADPADARYLVSDLDVASLSEGVQTMATAVADPGGPPVVLPARRDVGLTVVRVGRGAEVVRQARERAERFATGDTGGDELVLFADDVTTGYRVDVRVDGGPWLSLMRRVVHYRFDDSKLPAYEVHDEGTVDALTAVEQADADDHSYVFVGEEAFGFTGWSLAAPRPGPVVAPDAAPGHQVERIDSRPLPHFPLRTAIAVEPGTLPVLRYGRSYEFRARAVDQAGNSVDPQRCDPALVTRAVRYERQERVPAPVLVPRTHFGPGESLQHLVVRSGSQVKGDSRCERHVAAPGSPQHLAEQHGVFDAAVGPDSPERTRQRRRLLTLASRESGTFAEPTVAAPDGGSRLPAPGIRLTTSDPVRRPVTATLPLPRGDAPPNGAYVVHDSDEVHLPYLPDVAVDGAALRLPDSAAPVTVDYPGGPWPDRPPVRLVLRTGDQVGAAVVREDGRPVLAVTLPPATSVVARLSSTVDPAVLPVLRTDGISPKLVRTGQAPMVTPGEEIRLSHAAQRPLQPPVLSLGATEVAREPGTTSVTLTGTVTAHAASTAQVDVEAVWEEITDTGHGPVSTETRRSTVGSVPITGSGVTAFTGRQLFGDTRHRQVTYLPVGTTSWREYFDPATPTGDLQLAGAGREVDVLNARRPAPPRVHSIVPLLSWQREAGPRAYASQRVGPGVRIYLRRPWHTTGPGERLGVVVFDTDSVPPVAGPVPSLVSHWFTDPLERAEPAPHGAPQRLSANRLTNQREVLRTLRLVEMGAVSPGNYGTTVVGHEVHYDAERELWYADVAVNVGPHAFPFLRLALVRLQPHSVPGCHVSRVVRAEPAQLPPLRTLEVTPLAADSVRVRLTGPELHGATALARFHVRVPGPASEITKPVLAGSTTLTRTVSGTTVTYQGTLALPVGTNPTELTGGDGDDVADGQATQAALLAGRIVVEERQHGWSLVSPVDAVRTVYLETFDTHLVF
ncbi:hypothetical protein O7598_25010 [Micromonospora sp. WMMC241]|uniref:hypothetical protein n=1 Tax=Micromonospora sp. WMMC241 TaxID=3015159 RepID=UPI0022B724A5|nr:hypothetical protein [Micromonospora sp. WMMC241]MCZ7439685.1 hypothetical protein [Micromonospora sp. WMMC241]